MSPPHSVDGQLSRLRPSRPLTGPVASQPGLQRMSCHTAATSDPRSTQRHPCCPCLLQWSSTSPVTAQPVSQRVRHLKAASSDPSQTRHRQARCHCLQRSTSTASSPVTPQPGYQPADHHTMATLNPSWAQRRLARPVQLQRFLFLQSLVRRSTLCPSRRPTSPSSSYRLSSPSGLQLDRIRLWSNRSTLLSTNPPALVPSRPRLMPGARHWLATPIATTSTNS